jgi:pentatricopeptide repeat protein
MSARPWMINACGSGGLVRAGHHGTGTTWGTSRFPFSLPANVPLSHLEVEITKNTVRGRATVATLAAQDTEVSTCDRKGRTAEVTDGSSFDAALRALCDSKQYGKAWNLYRMHAGEWVQHLSYNSLQGLLSQCLRNGNLAAAVTVFEDMKSAGFRPNKVTFSMLISGLCKQRRKGSGFKEVGYKYWKELDRNHGSELDAAALRIGMQACVAVGKMREAEEILDLIERLDSNEGKRATTSNQDARTYNILINGYAKERNTAAIEALFRRMLTLNIRPTIITYNALVSSHVKSGRVDEAVLMIERAKGAGIAPDAWTYTSLMKGYINMSDFTAAKTVWRDMLSSGIKPTPVSYSVMIDCAIQEGDMTQAHNLLDIMHAQGERPSAITFNTLLRASVAGDYSSLGEAMRILDQMEEANVIPATDTFNMLMSAAVSLGDPFLTEDIYNRLVRTGQHANGFTYTILIQAYARQADLKSAVAAFEKLSKDRHADLDIAAYNAMVDAFARSGEMQAAERMLQRACSFAASLGTGPPVEAFGAVVTGYVRLKSVNAAVNTVRKFHSLGGQPDAQMLDQLVDLCVRTGEYKVAMQAVRALELVGAEVDKEKYKKYLLGKEEEIRNIARQRERQDFLGDDRGDGETNNSSLERFKFWLGLPNTYYR